MFNNILPFIVMLNPVGLFLYLSPVRRELAWKDYVWVLMRASGISFVIYIIFFVTGYWLFEDVFQISFETFRIFGGIVIFSFSYFFIVKGQRAFLTMKENLHDLASEIALPFMVGAGSLSLTILLSEHYNFMVGSMILFFSVVLVVGIIILLGLFRDKLPLVKLKIAFDKNMEILLRLNGFFMGAIGLDMIFAGIKAFFGL